MSLKHLDIQDEYRSDRCDLIRDFYIPCLENSTIYSRAVGFFSSTSMSAAAKGLTALIRSGGRMQLIASPYLSEEDAEAIEQGLKARETAIAQSLLHELDQEFEQVVHDRLSCLAWLLSRGVLEIKLAVPKKIRQQGLYHEKLGIFADADENFITFMGSANESSRALIDNFECIDVYWSWEPVLQRRVLKKVENFQRLWDNQTDNLDVLDFPEAAKQSLLRLCPKQPPDWEPGLKYDSDHPHVSNHPNEPEGEYGREPKPPDKSDPVPPTVLKVELRPRQVDALEAWKAADYQGILAMATGSGKTITGLACAADLEDLELVIIAAPTNEIVQQWVSELQSRTSFNHPILALGKAEQWMESLFRKLRLLHHHQLPPERLPVVVVGSYGELSKLPAQQLIDDAGGLPPHSLLIADEAHAAGATTYQRLLRDDFKYRLGLSATPIRQHDEERTEVVLNFFGGVIYEFTLEDAIAAGILCEYEYYVYPTELTEEEYAEFKDLSAQIGRLLNSNQDDATERAEFLAIRRANILKSAASKLSVLEKIVKHHPLSRGMIYCADIEQATEASRLLVHEGFRAVRYSSDDVERRRLLADFAQNRLDALVAVKCLDEGVDVPNADLAVILASDTSNRQFIQRRGRVLRTAPGKKFATLIDVIVVPPLVDTAPQLFEPELRRIIQFAQFARNRMSIIDRLVQELAPYGISHADLL